MILAKTVFVYTTFPSQPQAHDVTQTLLKERLVACVNLFPQMQSIYWWKDQIQTETEVAALYKTSAANEKRLLRRLEKIHPYDCPCLAVLSPRQVNAAYANWVLESVGRLNKTKSEL